jgi:hypothetical protein
MAIGVNAVWRIRPGGNAANGAGFDSTIAGAGNDYTQQDTAAATWTHLNMAGTTTLTDPDGGNKFASALIGNAVRVNSAYYFITGYTDANNVTVDRSATFTNAAGKVGGAAVISGVLPDCINVYSAAGNIAVGGNTVYIMGAGSNYPSSNDYQVNSYVNGLAGGNATNGFIKYIGHNGRPRIAAASGNALILYPASSYVYLNNIYFFATGGTYNRLIDVTNNNCIYGNVFDCNDQDCDGIDTVTGTYNSVVANNEIFGKISGPATRASRAGIYLNSTECLVVGNCIHHHGGHGIHVTNQQCYLYNNLIYRNSLNGINIAGYLYLIIISGNTVNRCSGHGIAIGVTPPQIVIYNNLITNITVATKYGLAMTTGTAAANNNLCLLLNNNAFYGNTVGNYTGCSAASSDVAITDDPFISETNNDYRLNSSNSGGKMAQGKGFPGLFPGNAQLTKSYLDIGAVQHADTSASANIIRSHIIQRIR